MLKRETAAAHGADSSLSALVSGAHALALDITDVAHAFDAALAPCWALCRDDTLVHRPRLACAVHQFVNEVLGRLVLCVVVPTCLAVVADSAPGLKPALGRIARIPLDGYQAAVRTVCQGSCSAMACVLLIGLQLLLCSPHDVGLWHRVGRLLDSARRSCYRADASLLLLVTPCCLRPTRAPAGWAANGNTRDARRARRSSFVLSRARSAVCS